MLPMANDTTIFQRNSKVLAALLTQFWKEIENMLFFLYNLTSMSCLLGPHKSRIKNNKDKNKIST